jgi:ubiquinone/menaquinone biosynthesis C-methylase UbiE
MSGAGVVGVSSPAAVFDRLAGSYDQIFTRSTIGRAQRSQVWQRLLLAFHPGDRVLEMNCGTGEDAFFLARNGISVVACEASSEMIVIAQGRKNKEANSADIQFRILPSESLHTLETSQPFDGAFSNFSGLNCVADLEPVAGNLATLVKPGGRVLLCLSSRFCLAEVLWFLARGQVRKAIRRVSGHTLARFDELAIDVFYPTVTRIRQIFAPWFQMDSFRAIGLLTPPSYLEQWASRHSDVVKFTNRVDGVLAGWPLLRCLGDHVLLEFQRNGR